MSINNMNKEMRPILHELERQGWELEDTNNGHTTARPPDKSKPLVTLSRCIEPRAMMNTISQLRRSGFIWPPPQPLRRVPTAMDDVVTSVDGVPVPTVRYDEAAAEVEQSTSQRLFEELCRAKENYKISELIHQEASAALLEAQRNMETAQEELQLKREELDLAKQMFVEFFDAA